MRTRTSSLGLLCVGLLLLSSPAPALAETTVSQVFQLPLTQTDWDQTTTFGTPGGPTYQNPFQIKMFDPSANIVNGKPGVLQSVNVKLDYEFDNTLTLRFVNASDITVTADGRISVFLPNNNVLSPSFHNVQTAHASPSDVFEKVVTYTSPKVPPFVDTLASAYTDQATLNQFIGSGTIAVPAESRATSSFTTTSANGFGKSVVSSLVTLTINYTFVPEPSSIVLTGLGCLGLVLMGGRARSRSNAQFNELGRAATE